MFLLSKSKSRAVVHHYRDEREKHNKLGEGDDDEAEASTSSLTLTVWRKSLVFSCTGFTVIGADGGLAYRVDNYSGRPVEITLMDGSGSPIFTLCRRKKLRVLEYWLVYEGEGGSEYCSKEKKMKKLPIFCVRKNMTKADVLAYVYKCRVSESESESEKRCKYVIEGSFRHRCCKILDDSRRVVGEIKKKEAMAGSGASNFGLEVFHLIVNPHFNSRFAMAIVLLLDQMYSY